MSVLAVGAAIAVAIGAAPASSLSLPTVSLTTPTITVQTPTVTVTPPPLPVKTPTVPVKTPTVKVEVPALPVKTPTVPLKTPTVPLKTPTVSTPTLPPSKTVTTKTPTLSTTMPTISTRTPAVGVSSGSLSVSGTSATAGTSSSSSGRPPAGGRQGSPGTGAAGQGSTSTGARGSSTGGSQGTDSAPAALRSYGGTAGDYGQLPVFEGQPGPRARARIAQREHLLKDRVARFQGCLSELPQSQRQLLELRTGLGPSRPLGPRAVAALMHVAAARFAHLERQAVRELSDAASTHACGRTSEVLARVASFISAGFGGGQAVARGGVEAVSYSAPATSPLGTRSSTMVGRILGADIPPVASDLILVLLLTIGTGAMVAVVMADAAGLGPRHAQWRQRVLNRIRWLR